MVNINQIDCKNVGCKNVLVRNRWNVNTQKHILAWIVVVIIIIPGVGNMSQIEKKNEKLIQKTKWNTETLYQYNVEVNKAR